MDFFSCKYFCRLCNTLDPYQIEQITELVFGQCPQILFSLVSQKNDASSSQRLGRFLNKDDVNEASFISSSWSSLVEKVL